MALVGFDTNAGNAASLSVTVPSGATVGQDILVLHAAHSDVAAPSTPAGWTVHEQHFEGSLGSTIYWRPVTSGIPGSSVTVTVGAIEKFTLILAALSGGDPSVGISTETPASVDSNGATLGALANPTGTAGGDRDLLSFACDRGSSNTNWTPPAGWTEIGGAYNTSSGATTAALATRTVTAGAFGGDVWTETSTTNKITTSIIVLEPAPVAPGVEVASFVPLPASERATIHDDTTTLSGLTDLEWLGEPASGGSDFSGAVTLAGAGTLAATGTLAVAAALGLTGSGALTLTGTPAVGGTLARTGSGALTLTGAPSASGTRAATGTGALSLTGTPAPSSVLSLTGSGTLTLSASGISGDVALSGSGALTLTGRPTITATIALTGTGSLTLAGAPKPTGTLARTGSGTLTLAATGLALTGTLTRTGAGTLTFTGAPAFPGVAALTGAGTLTTVGVVGAVGTLDLSGSGELAMSGASIGPGRDITITGALNPRRYAGTIGPRHLSAVIGATRYTGTIGTRHHAGTLTPRRWNGDLG